MFNNNANVYNDGIRIDDGDDDDNDGDDDDNDDDDKEWKLYYILFLMSFLTHV